MPNFRQRDVTDCGAACLAYVFHHYGHDISIALLRRQSGTNQSGTTALGLVDTAMASGFTAKGIRCPFEDLKKSVPLPAIAHLKTDHGQHYVVLTSFGKDRVMVMDPAVGKVMRWPLAKLQAQWTGVLVVLAPGPSFKPGPRTKSAFTRVCELLIPRKGILAQSFVGIILSTLLSLSTTIFVQKIVDNVIVDGNKNLLSLMGTAMLVVLVFRLVLGYFQGLFMLRAAQQIDSSIILCYYRHLLRLPQAFFDTMRIGEITSRVSDAIKIRNFLNNTFLSLLLNPLILIFSLLGMFFYSWKLALLSLGLIPLNAVLFFASNWLNRGYQRQIMERNADFEAHLVESLNAITLVRGFQLEGHMNLKSEGRLVRLLRTVWTASKLGLAVNSAGSLVTQAYTIGLLWIGTSEVLHSQLSAGELMSCYTLAGYFTGPLVALIGMNASIQEALIATDRLYEIIDLECEKDTGTAELLPEQVGDIRIVDLTFRHKGRLPVLSNFNLTIPQGKITALVGESGCGKSTLLTLIQRLYLPESGRILIGDMDIQYLRLSNLRKLVAVVPQQTFLLSGSVLENIAPGEPNLDMARVIQICRKVGMLDFIESLPNGFQTILSENGTNLSGGQRQRLAIIRAIYLDSLIILLDEPTSALDSASIIILHDLLYELRSTGKTIVLCSHQQSSINIADCTIVFTNGKYMQTFQHEHLSYSSNLSPIKAHKKQTKVIV